MISDNLRSMGGGWSRIARPLHSDCRQENQLSLHFNFINIEMIICTIILMLILVLTFHINTVLGNSSEGVWCVVLRVTPINSSYL